MTTLSTEADDDDDDTETHCHDCDMIASSPEEARSKGFCNVKAFDARRRVGGNDEDLQRPTIRLREDAYYWLCPGCFNHMRVTLPIVGGDLSDKFSHKRRQDLENGEGSE